MCALCAETLLDDFMLTHPIFLTADRFQQVLLQQYPSHTGPVNGHDGKPVQRFTMKLRGWGGVLNFLWLQYLEWPLE